MAAPCATAASVSREPTSRSLVRIVIGVSALVTGVAVLLIGVMLPDLQPNSSNDSAAAENQEAAREFYAAQDEALATGTVRRLTAAVAPYFIDHRPGVAAGQDRQGLADEMMALRRVRPGVRLTAEAFMVDRDRVVVYVSLHPTSHAEQAVATPSATSMDTVE